MAFRRVTSSESPVAGPRSRGAPRELRGRLSAGLVAVVVLALATGCEAPASGTAPSAPLTPEASSPQATAAPGAGAGGSPAVVAAAPPEPQAITTQDIPSALEGTDARLRQIEALLRPRKDVRAIGKELSRLETALAGARRSIAESPPLQQTRRALVSHLREWQAIDEQLENAAATLNRRSAPIVAALEDLERAREVWVLTTQGDLGDLPPHVAQRVREIPAAVSDLAKRVRRQRDELISLQSSLATARIDIADFLESIDAAIDEEQRRLWVRESLPLWKGIATPDEHGSVREQVQRAWQDDLRALRSFARLYGPRVWVHGLAMAALVVALHALRRRLDRRERPAHVRAAWASLLARPTAAALILGLSFSMWIYPRAPSTFFLLISLVLLPVVLVLLHTLVPAQFLGAMWTLAGLYLLDRVLDLALPGGSLHRVLLLCLTAASLAACAWHFRGGGPLTASFTGWRRHAARFLMRVLMVILVVSLFADAVGNASLAEFLTGLVLWWCYLALVAFTLVTVVRGLIVIGLHSAAAESLLGAEEQRDILLGKVLRWIDVLGFGLWIYVALDVSRVLDPIVSGMRRILGRHLIVGAISVSLGDVLSFALTLYASVLLSRLISFLVQEVGPKGTGRQRGVRGAIAVLVRYAVITMGFVLALAAAGLHLDRLTVLLGALGVGIGFGLQGLINNFVSGLILAFERPVQIGDVIEVGGLTGRAKEIGFRASTIETFDGAEVIVPNGELLSGRLVNWTLSDQKRRIEIKVGVAYGTDPARVLEILEDVGRTQPDALPAPDPFAVFRGFGESSLDFSLYFWTADFDRWVRIQSAAAVCVNEALKASGIAVPFPQRDLHLRSGWPPAGGPQDAR